jgi:RNA polymerase sigma-70 factor (ECF subfamily)
MAIFFRKGSRPAAADSTDLAELIGGVCREEQAALDQLYSLTISRVYALALRIVRNEADAEEVSCDVYQQVWRSARQWNPRRGSPLQWIMVIARTRALDTYRTRRWQRAQVHLDEAVDAYQGQAEPSVQELLEAFEAGSEVHAALSRLSAEQARLVGLAFFEGLTHPEIAERTQLPLGTVKSHIQRGLAALRKALADPGSSG